MINDVINSTTELLIFNMREYEDRPYHEIQEMVKIHFHYVSVICKVLDEAIASVDEVNESDLTEFAFYIEKHFQNLDIEVTCEPVYKEMNLLIKYKGNDLFLINI